MNLFKYTYELVRQIPAGKLSTYGAVARALGDTRASRAVGYMMHQNQDPDTIPCYKIVHSDGRLGGFGRGIPDKIRRLKHDNIAVKNGTIVDFHKVFFDDFSTTFPLKRCQTEQKKLHEKIILDDHVSEITTVAGIDVAYPQNAFDKACGAYVLMDYQTHEILEQKTVFARTLFPYIPTYLTYHELPVIKQLLKNNTKPPSVFLFDGHGVLHPRRCGLASHVGVLFDIPSVGVAKNVYLSATEKQNNDAYEKSLFQSVLLSPHATKPVIVSPGHKISLTTSVHLVQHLSKYAYPEPLRHAHILAKKHLKLQHG